MFDAFGGEQSIGHLTNAVGSPAHGEDFETVVVIEVDMQRGDDQVAVVMLDVGEQVQQMRFVMVVDQCDGAGDFVVAKLLLMFDELSAYHVGHGLRPIFVAFGAHQLIEITREFLVERDAESGDRFHRLRPV